VRVEVTNGDILDLLCKRGTSSTPFAQSYRRGVGHESEVYRRILSRISATAPRYFGSYADNEGQSWLFIEHMHDVLTVDRWPDTDGIRRAAEWLARFHLESIPARKHVSFLPRLDLSYFGFWADRALEFTRHLHEELPWLPLVLRRHDDLFGPLEDAPHVVIHGEFYPPNVLFDGVAVYPVDWECCAIGAPELDLAFLTEGWPPEVHVLCRKAYDSTIEVYGLQEISEDRLTAAKAYLAVRYLGHKPGLAQRQRGPERLEFLRATNERLRVPGA
jgi:aminoglycoside phosphotransferase (APT) family kinase protein